MAPRSGRPPPPPRPRGSCSPGWQPGKHVFWGKVFGRYHGVTLSIFRSLFGGVAFGALRYVRDLRYFLGASYVLRKGTRGHQRSKEYPPIFFRIHFAGSFTASAPPPTTLPSLPSWWTSSPGAPASSWPCRRWFSAWDTRWVLA